MAAGSWTLFGLSHGGSLDFSQIPFWRDSQHNRTPWVPFRTSVSFWALVAILVVHEKFGWSLAQSSSACFGQPTRSEVRELWVVGCLSTAVSYQNSSKTPMRFWL